MNTDEQRKKYEKWAKILGFGVVSFLFGPVAFATIQGAAGLIALLLIWTIGNAMVPVYARKLANWKLQAIKAEAARNPIETLENEYGARQTALKTFERSVQSLFGTYKNFKEEVDDLRSKHPEEAAKFADRLEQMRKLAEHKKALLDKGRRSLRDFADEIEKARVVWKVAQAANAASKAAGIVSGDDDILAKISAETAIDSVTENMNNAFAEIEVSLEAEPFLASPNAKPQLQQDFMKEKIGLALMLLGSVALQAQTNQPSFVKGTIEIKYNSRVPQTASEPDVYALNLNVNNSAILHGTIQHRPKAKTLGFTSQPQAIIYDLKWDVLNPANLSQRKTVGTIAGLVPIDDMNVYRYADGKAEVSIRGADTKKIGGLVAGKPPKKKDYLKPALRVLKVVSGKLVELPVTEYDEMTFNDHAVPFGPVARYPDFITKGKMIYDYKREKWYFTDCRIEYARGENLLIDRLGGDISWVPASSEYKFDIRINEPLATEVAAFANAAESEAAFFKEDATVPAILGTMKYRETKSGTTVVAQSVAVDLRGNMIDQSRMMNIAKLIHITCIVPVNAE